MSRSQLGQYPGREDNYRGLPSTFPSPASTAGTDLTGLSLDDGSRHGAQNEEPEPPKRKRFSKRHSKNGLTAVF